MPINDTVREGVLALAEMAADAILAIYAGEFAVSEKDDHSPLTAADMASHRRISAGLQALTPDIPVLSEESKGLDIGQRRQWRRFWLVDPLDGTREFIKRNGEFTINIALVEDGVASFGVIQQPVTGGLWHGGLGRGAWRRRDARDEAIHCTRPPRSPLRIAASRSHRDARTEALLAAFPDAKVQGFGSALKFCKLAEGAIDLYPRFHPTSEWDTAAGQAIVEAAGGVVVDPAGRPFRYNQRDTLINGDFIAVGDPGLLAQLPL